MLENYTFVCPSNRDLLDKINFTKIIIRINNIHELKSICNEFTYSNFNILVKVDHIKMIELKDFKTKNITIHSHTIEYEELDLSNQIRIFLSPDLEENYSQIRRLISYGIQSGIILSGEYNVLWLSMLELFKFYKENSKFRMIIEPFHSILSFKNRRFTNYNSLYYNDPDQFLHIDKYGNIAFTMDELSMGNIFANIKDPISFILKKIEQQKENYHSHFIQRHGCVSCLGWPICKGTFKGEEVNVDCKIFFSSLIEYTNFLVSKKENIENAKNNYI
jgi:hypothetical protein